MSGDYFGFDTTQAKTLQNLLGSDDTSVAAQTARIDALYTWAAALATKLNADAGVTDTDYDTTP